MIYKYNPKKITGSWKGRVNNRDFAIQFVGYMDGTFVTAEYDEDAATKHTGTQGETSVVLNANRGAKIVVVLVQGTPVNKELSDLVPNAKNDYLPVGVLTFDDLNGTTEIKAAEAWITKTAKVSFGPNIEGREWTFDTGEAEITVGGVAEEAA